MAEFSERKDLERWFDGRPRQWAIVIAARVALRTAPMLFFATYPARTSQLIGSDFLASFRGLAASWIKATYPQFHHNFFYAVRAISDTANRFGGRAGDALFSIVRAASVATDPTTLAEAAAAYAVDRAADAAPNPTDIWAAVSADATALEAAQPMGLRPVDLAIQVLWPTGTPTWVTDSWLKLKRALLEADEGWQVWTDWYEARLEGGPANEALELARAQIAEDIWAQDPKFVNGHIRLVVGEHLPMPSKLTAERVDFSDRENIARWLKSKPIEWATVFAARAALRVVPAVASLLGPSGDKVEEAIQKTVLSVFRAVAVSWVAAKFPNFLAGLRPGAAAKGAYPAEADTNPATRAALSAAYAADVVSYINELRAFAATGASADVAAAADRAVAFAVDAVYGTMAFGGASIAAASDASEFERGMSPGELAGRPLWPDGLPNWASENWKQLKTSLQAANDDWKVWISWYEARLELTAINRTLELDRVKIPEKIWSQKTQFVNAHINGLIKEHEQHAPPDDFSSDITVIVDINDDESKILGQRPAAFRFAVHADRIEAAPQQEVPPDEALALDIYAEVKSKANDFIDRLERSNSARRVTQTAKRLLDCLGANLTNVKPGILLMRHRSLEADAAAYETPEGQQQLFPDAIAMMRDLIATVDDLMGIYPSIRKIQASALALELQRADVMAVQERLEEIRIAATRSAIVAPSAQNALATALPDVEEINRTIETVHDDFVRAAAIDKRAQIVSLQVLDYRNFVSAVVHPMTSATDGLRRLGTGVSDVAEKSLKEAIDAIPRGVSAGVEESVKGLIKGGIATLVGSIFGPVAGLAVLVASLKPLARKTEEVKNALEEKPAPKADDQSGTEESVEE